MRSCVVVEEGEGHEGVWYDIGEVRRSNLTEKHEHRVQELNSIKDGDQIWLFTNVKDNMPLPHPVLFDFTR
jgi:hypothetical protein